MREFWARGVLPFLATTAVIVILVVIACAIIEAELALSATMRFADIERTLNAAFVAFLFVFAMGLVPGYVLKKLRIRSFTAYALGGVVCGFLAEHCYFLELDIWDSWDFTVPPFANILSQAMHGLTVSVIGMGQLFPESAIPLGLGLIASALYWLLAGRRAVSLPEAAPAPAKEQLFRSR